MLKQWEIRAITATCLVGPTYLLLGVGFAALALGVVLLACAMTEALP